MSYKFIARTSFAVPAGAGAYAPERITFAAETPASVPAEVLLGVTTLAESGPVDAVAELWLRKVGATDNADASFFNSGKSITGLTSDTFALASWPGAQIRVKSGGTAGTTVINATAD